MPANNGMMPRYDTLWINAHLATMSSGRGAYGSIEDGALGAKDGNIAWIGRTRDVDPADLRACDVIDAGGRLLTPGVVDPHTHLIFAGDRVADFERRASGESYVAAARGGSGIQHTVDMTRAAGSEKLFSSAERRLRALVAGGATTVEIKSGYGLDVETELLLLRLARRLGESARITVRATYLGAHVVPNDFAGRRGDYLDLVCDVMLPRIAAERLADAVDVFCDTMAFSLGESTRVLAAATSLGLPVKVHADQVAETGAAELAAAFGALSADHLEKTTEAGVRALARAGTVAVLLPGAYHYLRETVTPPIAALRKHGVPIALATDCNPGTSPILSATTILNFACVLFGLTPQEALGGVTREAARALGLRDRGELRAGTRCDLALWNVDTSAELCYWLGVNPCAGVVVAGRPLGDLAV